MTPAARTPLHWVFLLCLGASACAEAAPFSDGGSTFVTPDAQPVNSLNNTPIESPIKSLSLHSGTHACAVSSGGVLKCWGNNASGQLGLGDTTHRGTAAAQMGNGLPAVATGLTVADVAAGTGITCALGSVGEVKCWGNNSAGQLGVGDTTNRGISPADMGTALGLVPLGVGRHAVQIAAGVDHVCVLLDNGGVRCWGNNAAGQLGIGDTAARGDQPSELGDALPQVNLGTGRRAVFVGSGAQYACALLDNAKVKCWGINNFGQLGLGDTVSRGQTPSTLGDNLPTVDLGPNAAVAALDVGQSHSCALLTSGQVKCWGDNSYCMLGLGDQTNRGDAANEMGNALPAVALGTGRIARQVSVGWGGACAVLDTGALKCWGYNYYGGLGVGDTANRGCAAGQMGDDLPAVQLGSSGGTLQQVRSAGVYNCVLLQGGVKCWGYNDEGNLGLGDTTSRGAAPQDLGERLPWVSLFP